MRGVLVVLICAGFAQAQDVVQWVYFESAETGKGAVLKLEMLDGSKKELAVASDTVMLQYIEGFIGARHKRLSVDLADKNRTLLRFETPQVDKVQKAELVLNMQLSRTPPLGDFTVAVHTVKTKWDERWVRWPLQPDYDTQAKETIRLKPRAQVVRIPMTDLVNEWLNKQTPNHGICLRVDKPFPAGEKRGVQPKAAEKRGAVRGARAKRMKNDERDWISVVSREAANGPRLLLEIDGGGQKEIPVAADAGVISYLADRKWGALRFMAISLNDSNRMLLRFEMPPKLGKVKKATLRLDTTLSRMDPPQKFDVALHPLTKAWKEMETDWLTQPKMAEKAVATFEVPPATRARTLSFDVTELVNGKTGLEHGWLLKVAKPMGKAAVKKDARGQRAAQQILLQKHDLKWLASVDAALKEAKAKDRMVLALVDGTWDINKPSFGAKLLMATALVDPDIRTLIEKRFVPVRIAYRSQAYTTGGGQSPELRKLGTKVLDAKAPALVVSDATGKHVATLASFGTYDKHQVLHFLAKTLPPTVKGGDPYELLAAGDWVNAARGLARLETAKARRARARLMSFMGKHDVAVDMLGLLEDVESRAQMGVAQMRLGRFELAENALTGTEVPEGRYYLGCLLHRKRSLAEARAQWQAIPASSKWSLPANMRLSMTNRIAMFETLAAIPLRDARRQSTEAPAKDEKKAIAYLLQQQLENGSWPIGDHQQEMTRPAITALAAKALIVWNGDKDAIKKALAYLEGWMKKTKPEHANSFSTAYILDLQLERFARDKTVKADVQRAVDYLFGGQTPNGAWSYDKRFAMRWRGGFGGWPKTDKGRVHSMNTGPALVYLTRARDLGFKVSAKDLERGREILQKMKQKPAAFTYTYPEPISWEKEEFSIGRAPVCEQALWMLTGKKDAADLKLSLQNFMKWRTDLRAPVKLTPGWTMPRGVSSYFYFFAYYHAARAIDALGGPDAKKRLQTLRADLMAVAEEDGTWVDYPAIGKPYGTAMALLVLDMGR